MNQRILIAGGTGFLGHSLADHLARAGYEIVVLSRNQPRTSGPWRHVTWDSRTLGDWKCELNGAHALVNLTGRSVDCIKTPDHQDEILRSRVESTRILGQALRAIDNPPPVWVQMSTAHIYGDPPDVVCDENSAFGYGLAPTVGQAWEAAHRDSLLPKQRSVVLRTSFVLGRNRGVGNGALAKLALLTRFGLGGRIASGRQGFSWIHEHDLNRIVERALTDETMHGPYNTTAPHPVAQAEFMRELRRAVGMPIGLPAPAWGVRIAAPLLLRTDPELAIFGRYVIPKRLLDERCDFQFARLRDALADLFGARDTRSLS